MARAFHTGSRHNRTPPRPLHAGKEAILNSTYPTGCTYSRKRNLPIRRAASRWSPAARGMTGRLALRKVARWASASAAPFASRSAFSGSPSSSRYSCCSAARSTKIHRNFDAEGDLPAA